MLQTIREHTQGWIAGVIISLIIFSFALWGIHSYFTGNPNNPVIAKVNSAEISQQQLSIAYDRLKRQIQSQYGTAKPLLGKDETLIKQRAKQMLIEVEALKQASVSQGFRLSDQQIDSYLQSMPAFQVDGSFSFDKFQEMLSLSSMSTSEFLELIKTSLLIDQPKVGIILTAFALPNETAESYALINQERDLAYTIIPIQSFLKQPITITAAQIQDYYQKHQAGYTTSEQVSIEYIELSLKAISETIKPSDVILRNFYNENIHAYSVPSQWQLAALEFPFNSNQPEDIDNALNKAKQAAMQLKANKSLKQTADQYNAHLTQTDWVSINQMPNEWQNSIAVMGQPGQVTDPIRTAKSWTVIKIIDNQPSKILDFEQAKSKVKEAYIRQHAEEKYIQMREKLADVTYENPESLVVASNALALPVKLSKLFSKEKSTDEISQYPKVRETAFNQDVLSLQNNSDVIQLTPDLAVVLRIKSHVPAKVLPLSDVSKQIEEKIQLQQADFLAERMANELKDNLQSKKTTLQSIADKHHYKLIKTGYVGRYANHVDPAVIDLAFRLPNPKHYNNQTTYGVARVANGFAIVGLNSVKSEKMNEGKQLALYSEQIQTNNGLVEYELYKQAQMDQSKIKVYE